MTRTTEFVLGLLGGIFGFFSSMLAIFIGGIDSAFGGGSGIIGLGISAMIFSLIGIVGSVVVKSKAKLGGIIMLICGIAILISISAFGILPALLLGLGGIIGLVKKD